MMIAREGSLNRIRMDFVASRLTRVVTLSTRKPKVCPPKSSERDSHGMLSSLEVGDSVCTTGGFYGIVVDVEEDTVIVEFGNKNCRIPMKKEAIVQVEKPEDAVAAE